MEKFRHLSQLAFAAVFYCGQVLAVAVDIADEPVVACELHRATVEWRGTDSDMQLVFSDKPTHVQCTVTAGHPTQIEAAVLQRSSVSLDPIAEDSSVHLAPAKATSTVVILVDTSDPGRVAAVAAARQWVSELAAEYVSASSVALARFDTSFEVLQEPTRDLAAIKLAARKLRAQGQSTELYRHVRTAVRSARSWAGDGLAAVVLISDGRFEDLVVTLDDVVTEALLNPANPVRILSLGHIERDSESPSLQSMLILAERTAGRFVQVQRKLDGTRRLTADDRETLVNGLQPARNFLFELTPDLFGDQRFELTLAMAAGRELVYPISLAFGPAPSRPTAAGPWRRLWEALASYWHWIAIGLSILFLLWLLRKILRKRGLRPSGWLRHLDDTGRQIALKPEGTHFGRGSSNDVNLANDTVSGRQAIIYRNRDGEYILSDLGSKNGTSVNGELIGEHGQRLNNGDLVEFGEVRFEFVNAP